MLICEIKTNKQLIEDYLNSDEVVGVELEDAINYYLSLKSGVYSLKTMSNDRTCYTFVWLRPDSQILKGKKKNVQR